MLERIKHMLIKEFIQIFRDPRMKTVIFLIPMIQLMFFGYAVTTDVKHMATAVYDLDNSTTSRELIARFAETDYFDMVIYAKNPGHIREMLDRGVVRTILQINKGFENNLQGGKTASLQMIIDGTDSNTAGIVLDYSAKITGEFSQKILNDRLSRTRGAEGKKPVKITLEKRALFNENLESRNFYVPGVIAIIAIIVMLITLMLTSMAVVREKEIGTMEQIMVTPITPAEFILGKTIPFALIGFIDVVLIFAVGLHVSHRQHA